MYSTMANLQTPLLTKAQSEIALRRRKDGRFRILKIAACIAIPLCYIFYLRLRQAVVPDVVDHDFGVGFDLTSPYG
jgi:hypothetical protein